MNDKTMNINLTSEEIDEIIINLRMVNKALTGNVRSNLEVKIQNYSTQVKMNELPIYHISILRKAIENYNKSSISGNMTIREFIELTCKDILNEVIEQID